MHEKKHRVALLSVFSNMGLVAIKLCAGLIMGSVSVLSEAIHSAIDLLASIIAWLSVRKSAQPADKEHPFGHGKFENISGAVEALLIAVAAIWIIYEAIHKLRNPAPVEAVGLGVVIMLISCIVNLFVSRKLFKVGTESESVALKADGWHLMTDVYTSLGVMIALGIMLFCDKFVPSVDLHWVDPVAALLVAMLIVKAAWSLTHESIHDLLDASLTDDEEEWIRQRIRESGPDAMGFHGLRTRKSGRTRFIEFHLMVDSAMSVGASHSLTDRLEELLKKKFDDLQITIHIEPCDKDCSEHCREGCFNPVASSQ